MDRVLAMAQGAVGSDPEGYRREFLDLVRQAKALKLASQPPQDSSAPDKAPGSGASTDTPPVLAKKAAPRVPRPDRNTLPAVLWNSEITVVTRVFVDAQGRPLKVLIEKGVDGSFGYNEAAREAALASTFLPGRSHGQPAPGWITLQYRFDRP